MESDNHQANQTVRLHDCGCKVRTVGFPHPDTSDEIWLRTRPGERCSYAQRLLDIQKRIPLHDVDKMLSIAEMRQIHYRKHRTV